MFDPIQTLVVNTLRANEKIIMDGQYDVDSGETFRVSFVAKCPAPNNQADIDLSDVFAAFPDGFAVQRIANLSHTMVRLPVSIGGYKEECRGTFMLTVTKANWQKGTEGTQGEGSVLSIEDIVAEYSKLPEHQRKQFLNAATSFLSGLAL